MQMRPQGWLYMAAFAMLAAGCATTTTGDDARTARLPTGVTLLESDRSDCAGTVTIDEGSIAGTRTEDLVVQRGQNAIFEVDADEDEDVEIDWACVGTATAERERVECPEETSHVRITREASGNEFLLECYGDRDGSTARARR